MRLHLLGKANELVKAFTNFLRTFKPELLVAIALAALAWISLWSKKDWEYFVLTSDGRGYYAYLPALFIHHDLSFQASLKAEEEVFEHWPLQTYLHQNEQGDWFNKYFPGWALLTLPAFLVAWLIQWILYGTATGYEPIFLAMIHVSSLFYGLLGFHAVRRLISIQVPQLRQPAWIAVLLLFGTNLVYYAALKPTMNHVHSFAMISLFMLFISRFGQSWKNRHLIGAALTLGVIAILRPTNLLVILSVPFLLGSYDQFVRFLRSLFNPIRLAAALGAFSIPVFIMMSLNMIQIGSPLNWSYKGEGFYWLDPEFLKVLFSPRNGWILYSPLIAIAFFYLFRLWKIDRWKSAWLGAYWFVVVYLISAWWNWYYGGGFGHRAFIDHYALIGIMLAGTWVAFEDKYIKVLKALALTTLLYNGAIYYKTLAGILPIDHVNGYIFRSAMLSWSPSDAGRFQARNDIKPFGEFGFSDSKRIIENPSMLSADEEFGYSFETTLNDPSDYPPWYLDVDIALSRNSDCDVKEFYFVVETFLNQEKVQYIAEPIYYDTHANHEDILQIHFGIMPIEEPIDRMKVYIWNRSRCDATISQFDVMWSRISD